jgi:hypothetical protein
MSSWSKNIVLFDEKGDSFYIWGSHGDYYYFLVEVLGFGAVWICRLMLTFRRNILSLSPGDEVTRQGNRGLM